ncbi:hypothetical protein [Gorillibacterium sp. sgz500922]|uniref:hypothetical protein n=1 Tax=Gorillibacterium sp. sgz500922 TaxID=3446694 RepID=UPI003F681E52
MDKPFEELSRRKPATPQPDGRLRNFVEEVSGTASSRHAFLEPRSGKNRLIDEQNKLIDKQNLRK